MPESLLPLRWEELHILYMNQITVRVKMFHAFEKYLPAGAEKSAVTMRLAEGTTVQALLENLGISDDQPKIILINGQSQGVCTSVKNNVTINEGDTVSIFPPVAGG